MYWYVLVCTSMKLNKWYVLRLVWEHMHWYVLACTGRLQYVLCTCILVNKYIRIPLSMYQYISVWTSTNGYLPAFKPWLSCQLRCDKTFIVQVEQAIETYERILRISPDHKEAIDSIVFLRGRPKVCVQCTVQPMPNIITYLSHPGFCCNASLVGTWLMWKLVYNLVGALYIGVTLCSRIFRWTSWEPAAVPPASLASSPTRPGRARWETRQSTVRDKTEQGEWPDRARWETRQNGSFTNQY